MDSSVIDEHVEAGILPAVLLSKFAYGLLTGSIDVHDDAVLRASMVGYLISCLLAASEVAAGKYKVRTERCELSGNLFTEARGRTGNDYSLAFHGIALGMRKRLVRLRHRVALFSTDLQPRMQVLQSGLKC
jgi:hypothetical protein